MNNRETKNRLRLFLVFLCAAGGLIFLIFWGCRVYLTDSFTDVQAETMTAYVRWQAQTLQTRLASVEGQMDAAARGISTTDGDARVRQLEKLQSNEYLESAELLTVAQWQEAAAADAAGTIPGGTAGEMRQDPLALLAGGQYLLSGVWRDGTDFDLLLNQPVLRDEVLAGVLRCRVNLAALVAVEEEPPRGKSLSFCILDTAGTVLYSPEADYVHRDLLNEAEQNALLPGGAAPLREAMAAGAATSVRLAKTDEPCFLTLVPLNTSGWSLAQVSASAPLAELLSRMRLATWVLAGFLFLVFFGGLAACVWFSGRADRSAKQYEARYSLLAEFTDTVLFQYEYGTDTLHLTENVRGLLPLGRTELLNFSKRDHFSTIAADDVPRILSAAAALRAGAKEVRFEVSVQPAVPGEALRWFECYARAVPGERDRPAQEAIGKITDITARKANELVLLRQSMTDGLTGLLNRGATEARVNDALAADPHGALFMLDVDDFKSINDNYGHSAGDNVLKSVAGILSAVFGTHDMIGRIGGDEFVVFVPGAVSDAEIARTYSALHTALQELDEHGGPPLTVSLGVALAPGGGGDFVTLFGVADKAMYTVKRSGKDRYEVR